MRLQTLKLRNFKGIRNYTFAPQGQSVTVLGDNATGKTTLFDALTWLLFDKDSRGRTAANFSIKTRDESGNVIHQSEHEVEGVFDDLTLRKVYTEKWVTRRGSSEPVFDGHTTDHFIDDVPAKKSEYDERVSGIMSEEMFRILTNPLYFPEELHWSERRKVLLDMCGEVSESDIIESGEAILERYPDVLDGKSQDDREKMLKARKKKLSEQLENIPSRIDENRRMIEPVEGLADAKQDIKELKSKKDTIEAKRAEIKSGGAVADLNVKRQELQAEYKRLESEHNENNRKEISGQREKIAELESKVDESASGYRDAKRKAQETLSEVEGLEVKAEGYRKEIKQTKARKPKPKSEFTPDVCPMCERPMEDEGHDYDKYLEEFNAEKADELKYYNSKLEEYEEVIALVQQILEDDREAASKAKGRLNQRKEALLKAKKKLDDLKQEQPDFGGTEQAQQIEEQLEDIDRRIADHRQEKAEQLQRLEDEIEKIEGQIEQKQKLISVAEGNDRARQRIKELQEEQKGYASELEQVEEDLFVIEKFKLAESRYISRSVNGLFDMVEWKLFEEQVNGGINDQLCEATVGGIPFTGGLNDGARLQAGLDIIQTLSDYYGKQAPVFVDGAESVTRLPDSDLQVIRLVVSPEHPSLTVKSEPEKEPTTVK